MKFKYNARTQEGELQTGFVDAANRQAALNILIGHDLFVLSMEGAEKISWLQKTFGFLNRVKISDVMIFTRQFATLMESKVPLDNSLRSLRQQTRNVTLKEAIADISSDIDAGLSLSQALERQSAIFSEFYVNMIRSAEITGRLEEVMVFLAEYLEKEAGWRSRVRNALIYPTTVVALFVVVAIVMLVVVFPQIGPIFEESNVELPILTQIFLSTGYFLLEWWWILVIIAVMLIFLAIDYFQKDEGKAVLNEITVKIPVLGGIFKKIYVARFAESISVLIKGGIPLTQALEISSHTIGNIIYRDILHEIAEGVRGGASFSNLLSENEYYFPPLVGQMVAIGENTGRLEEILSRVSAFFTREVNDVLNNLVELIQPILIAVIGALIGLLFASILIPIYNLAQAF
jgi:type II secretory pathway component PulF